MKINKYYIIPLLLFLFLNNFGLIDQNDVDIHREKQHFFKPANNEEGGDAVVEHKRFVTSVTVLKKRIAKEFIVNLSDSINSAGVSVSSTYSWDTIAFFELTYFSPWSRATFS